MYCLITSPSNPSVDTKYRSAALRIPLLLTVDMHQMNRRFSFDKANHPRNGGLSSHDRPSIFPFVCLPAHGRSQVIGYIKGKSAYAALQGDIYLNSL